RLLLADAAFALAAASGLWLAFRATGEVRAGRVLAVAGVAALLPGAGVLALARRRVGARDLRRAARLLVGQGKWTLPGMAVTWGQTTGYAYIVAWFLGSAAVAELSAARLFVMPLNTLMTAWGRIFVPRAGALLATGDRAGVLAQSRRNAVWLLAAA